MRQKRNAWQNSVPLNKILADILPEFFGGYSCVFPKKLREVGIIWEVQLLRNFSH